MKAGIKVINDHQTPDYTCCSSPDLTCVGSDCMAWNAVGGFRCSVCGGINIDRIDCCGDTMNANTKGSCGMVGS